MTPAAHKRVKALSQLYWLNREIERQQKRLRELESAAQGCTSRITGMPHASGVFDKIGEFSAEIADLKAIIGLNLQKCIYEQSRLQRFINTVDDSMMRLILQLRYVNGLPWLQIAFSIGETDEQYPRRKHNDFMEKCKLDENDEQKEL
jgi:hypothetical protein